jgi:hypothetical protein
VALASYLFWGCVIGAILIVLYVLVAAGATHRRPDLGQAIGLLLAANGITAAIRLFMLVFTARSLGALTQTDRIYLVVGAIAALWLSLETIGRIFLDVSPPDEDVGMEPTGEPDEQGPE